MGTWEGASPEERAAAEMKNSTQSIINYRLRVVMGLPGAEPKAAMFVQNRNPEAG